LNLEGQATATKRLTGEGKCLEAAWSASQVCLKCKPSCLAQQATASKRLESEGNRLYRLGVQFALGPSKLS